MAEPAKRRWNVSAAVFTTWALALLTLGSFPGFGGPSYPYGLIAGVLVGPWGAVWSLYRTAKADARGVQALAVGLNTALALVLALVAVALIHGLRVGFCDLGSDLTRLLLGAGTGALVACVWGTFVAQCRLRRGARCALALLFPLASYGASFVRFYTSPMVFAFDHFAGYFAGTLYDTDLGTLERLWSYRAGTLGLLACLACLVSLSHVPRLLWWTRRGTLGLAVTGLLLAFGVYLQGPRLGHYQTTESIAATLGSSLASARCDVLFDVSLGREAAALLGRECDAHVTELEQKLEVEAPKRIRVFLFASADQKALLMGARHVYVAKPWRQEIYINAAPFPHPVLRHELAHVVAGVFGRGPFKVAGNAFGWLPDPGRIEGLAVMAAPPEDETLTLAEWSAAMKRLDIMPPLSGLFQLGFFSTNSSSAYTVAGAFLEWVAANHGMACVKAWYAGSSLEVLTGSSWSELERQFRAYVDTLAVSERELEVARSRFERPAVLHRRCPHQVDGALTVGLQRLARGDCDQALQVFDEVLRMDASALRAQFGRAECAQRAHDTVRAREQYQAVAASPFAGSDYKTAAFEKAGDVAWQEKNVALALQMYTQAQSTTLDEDTLRQLDIKLGALQSPNLNQRQGVERFFFGPDHKGSFPLHTGNLLGQWVAREPLGLGSYLLGKQYLSAAQWRLATEHLAQALRGNLQPRVRREALRSSLVASCAQGDHSMVSATWRELEADEGLTAAQLAGFHALARRCALL